MKKLIFVLAALFSAMDGVAQIQDAFDGIWPVTDRSVMKSLNGEWKLKVVEEITDDRTVPQVDDTWGTIPVPGCWEAYGYCKPTYSYPDSLTGYYRTDFVVPKDWKGERVCIRLDGVLRGYDLWLNDQLVGTWELPYNTKIFDLTPYLSKKAFKGERQKISLRVYSQYPGFKFDCFDDWAPMGIFRDVTLFHVPATHLSDLSVTTKTTGEVAIDVKVAGATKNTSLAYSLTDTEGNIVAAATSNVAVNNGDLDAVTAASPQVSGSQADTHLRAASLSKPKAHSSNLKVPKPLLWTAETPHLYTLHVYVKEKNRTLQTFTQKIGLRELTIENGNVLTLNGSPVKLRGVTTHATDPRSVKVIDETLTLKDLKMMKEASVNYIRTSHYPREPRFYELCDSMGFYVMCEVPFGSRGKDHLMDETFMDNLKTRANATIDRHKNYPSVVIWSLGNENPLTDMCVRLGEYVKQYDPHHLICYPQTNGTMTHIGFGRFPKVADIYAPHYPSTDQVRTLFPKSNRPVIFTEYLHSLGISFEDHDRQWEIIQNTPCLAGGSIWEWVDQGMPFKKHRDNRYGYEERVYTSPEGGFEMNGNKGTDGLLYADRTPLPNYYEMQHNYAQAFTKWNGSELECFNRYDFINLKDNVTFKWTLTDGHTTLAEGTFSPDCPARQSVTQPIGLLALKDSQRGILNVEVVNREGWTLLRQAFCVKEKKESYEGVLQPAQLDPMVRVGRKPTLAEVMKVNKARVGRYLQPVENKYVKAEIGQEGPTVSYTLTPDTTRRYIGEMGVAYLLDKDIDRVQWLGQGPYATYPGRHQANRYGIWSMQMDDLYFEGNRMGVEACWLSDKNGNGILISGDSLNINFEQTDRGIVVTVNVAVSGECPKFGSSSFGLWSNKMEAQTGKFEIYSTKVGQIPQPFTAPTAIPAPFRPFYTQYDTYLMRFEDITPKQ